MKELLAPIVQRTLTDVRLLPVRLSAQLLAARLHMNAGDPAGVRQTFLSESEPQIARLAALDAMVAFRDPALPDALPKVLADAPTPFAAKIFLSLGHLDDPKLGDSLLALYPKLAPDAQPLAIDLMMQREPWARKLLDAVLAGKVPKGALNANHLRKIMESDDRDAIWAVEKTYGQIRSERNPEREKVVAEMGDYLRKNIGDPFAGEHVFRNFCANATRSTARAKRSAPTSPPTGERISISCSPTCSIRAW